MTYNKEYYIKNKDACNRRTIEWAKRNPIKTKANRLRNSRTVKGWFTKVYGTMKNGSIKRNISPPNFTKCELIDWVYINNKEKFSELFSLWIKSNYSKDLTPSINRIDDYKSYTLDNIELTTWKENNDKGRKSEKTIQKVHNKLGYIAKSLFSKKVIQKDISGNAIKIFPSTREASRQVPGTNYSTISSVCRGEHKSHHGFIWEYYNGK